jgi:hypothetical protein
MSRQRLWSLVMTLMVLAAGCTAAQAEETSQQELLQAHTRYVTAVGEYVTCLRSLGVDVSARPAANGVLYQYEFDNPIVASEEEWNAYEQALEQAKSDCVTAELLDSTGRVETLTAPSEEELWRIAETCATELGVETPKARNADSALNELADQGIGAASCIVRSVTEFKAARYGDLAQPLAPSVSEP